MWQITLKMTYSEFVEQLNSGKFDRVEFAISGYGHYSHCVVNCLHLQDGGLIVEFLLTPNGKECVRYFGAFRDDKIFRMERKRYTLQDVWNRVELRTILPHAQS